VRLPEGAYDVFNLALSPGGERLFVILARLNVRESELWRIELPAGEPELVYAPPGVRLGYFDVAPDGQTIAMAAKDGHGAFRPRLIAPDGAKRTLVEPLPGDVLTSPMFSSDGKRVAFVRSGPPPTGEAQWLDLDTGRLTRVGPAAHMGVLDWRGPNVLLVATVGVDDVTRVRELSVDDGGRIGRERDVFSVPADVELWKVQVTAAGGFIQRGPIDGRPRVAVLPLAGEAPKLRVLPTGSEEDFHAAGFTSSGDIVIAARAAAQDSLLIGTRERGFKAVGSLRELG